MINFTVGPVQMDDETRELGKNQIPYFRTAEFSAIMKEMHINAAITGSQKADNHFPLDAETWKSKE